MAFVKASHSSIDDMKAKYQESEPEREMAPKSRASEIASKHQTEKKKMKEKGCYLSGTEVGAEVLSLN